MHLKLWAVLILAVGAAVTGGGYGLTAHTEIKVHEAHGAEFESRVLDDLGEIKRELRALRNGE